jgi:hypothetical protein
MVSTASATLLEAEPFDYPASLGASVNTLNGGTGWGAAWADADSDVTLASTNLSLSYPPGALLTPAGSRIALTATDATAQATRNLGTTMGLSANGQNWYSSALFNRSAVTGETATISFFSGLGGTGNLRWFYGIDGNGNFTVAVDPSMGTQRATSVSTATADTTYLVVARFRTNTGPSANDEVFLKAFSPTDTVSEPLTDAGWTLAANGNSGVTLSSIRLDFANDAAQVNQFDEFRIGTTFADVTGVPEPSSAILLAVGSLLLAGRRRARK